MAVRYNWIIMSVVVVLGWVACEGDSPGVTDTGVTTRFHFPREAIFSRYN